MRAMDPYGIIPEDMANLIEGWLVVDLGARPYLSSVRRVREYRADVDESGVVVESERGDKFLVIVQKIEG